MTLNERVQGFMPSGLPADECWPWQGAEFSKDGYGRLQHPRPNGKWGRIYAHRAVWEAFNGPVPTGLRVCHNCDNPPCVNPNHLFLGTSKDNTEDMTKKGRHGGRFEVGHVPHVKGDTHPQARLTQVQADEIRALHATTRHLRRYSPDRWTAEKLAAKFDVSKKTVLNILHDRIWRGMD